MENVDKNDRELMELFAEEIKKQMEVERPGSLQNAVVALQAYLNLRDRVTANGPFSAVRPK